MTLFPVTVLPVTLLPSTYRIASCPLPQDIGGAGGKDGGQRDVIKLPPHAERNALRAASYSTVTCCCCSGIN